LKSTLVAQLAAERRKKDARGGWQRRRADRRHVQPTWLEGQPGRVFLGADLVTVVAPGLRLKYVFPNPYYPYSPGELARLYLERLAREQLQGPRISDRWLLSKADKAKLAIPAPLYFDPARGRDGHFTMVDIASCYWELLLRWPLNIDSVGSFLCQPRPACIVPEADRAAIRRERALRHAIWGCLRGLGLSSFKGGAYQSASFVGKYLAPGLVGLVMDAIHEIARAAVRNGARMWLTDAGIFDHPLTAGLFRSYLLAEWGLGSTIKADGQGHLWAAGDYRIGHRITRGNHTDQPGLSTVRPA
jgi:hypothetical protein